MPSQKETENDEKGDSCKENEQKELPHIDISSSSESDSVTCSSLCYSPVVEKVCVLEIVS